MKKNLGVLFTLFEKNLSLIVSYLIEFVVIETVVLKI
jgi:hypothetical protein